MNTFECCLLQCYQLPYRAMEAFVKRTGRSWGVAKLEARRIEEELGLVRR